MTAESSVDERLAACLSRRLRAANTSRWRISSPATGARRCRGRSRPGTVAGGPAGEDIASGPHQVLPGETRPSALLYLLLPHYSARTGGWASLACKNNGSIPSPPSIRREFPTLPTRRPCGPAGPSQTALADVAGRTAGCADTWPPPLCGVTHTARRRAGR